ncbi:uncharacterized protein M421DRAFT_219488 [Didymella exigua CBS 183.55]|uniref:Uncharacterized protein n=1 Tax=Didymella exigua CBS 183.55 TaxID=1150837 RepID=A0A6A5RFI5_9PLEO|nr:uncharacterized protein M421DRAFT_219488 [Didymella exigua CBS 183.55]KAF1926219.1 hypothetical protein M421DRAFT_219488 [Didymella exigua CBS 183.55]
MTKGRLRSLHCAIRARYLLYDPQRLPIVSITIETDTRPCCLDGVLWDAQCHDASCQLHESSGPPRT